MHTSGGPQIETLTLNGFQILPALEAAPSSSEHAFRVRHIADGVEFPVTVAIDPEAVERVARLTHRRLEPGGALTFNFASLYATLYKLEERKWIQGRWVEKAGQRRRRYYKITPEGRDVLAAQRKEWRQFFELIRDLAGVRYA